MIGVLYFPGTNCEEETLRLVNDVGLSGQIIRWNQIEKLDRCKALIIPGGWSFEDRVRAGAIASKSPIMVKIKDLASKGIPILGICNGAQILAESGLIGDLALAPNKNPFLSGYYCEWVWIKVKYTDSPWLTNFKENDVLMLPVAHGEGRFISSSDYIFKASLKQKALVYCDKEGNEIGFYPINPNGATENIAGFTDVSGRILALMPHPERASYAFQSGGRTDNILSRKVLESLKSWLEAHHEI